MDSDLEFKLDLIKEWLVNINDRLDSIEKKLENHSE
jgi:hypothetical protein